jgi:hypothetical protein
MEIFISNNNSVKPCTNETEAMENSLKFHAMYKLESALTSECPVPCKRVSYKLTMNDYHINSFVDTENRVISESQIGKSVILFLSFLTTLVEEETETLIYDFPNFLAAGTQLFHINKISCKM